MDREADYLLCVKDNQSTLKKDIEDYVQDTTLRKIVQMGTTKEKNYRWIKTRTAYVTSDIEWMGQKDERENLCCIGAVHTEFTTKKGISANGITIYQAGISLRSRCSTMPRWNGLWKYTGSWMYILRRTGVGLMMQLFSRWLVKIDLHAE